MLLLDLPIGYPRLENRRRQPLHQLLHNFLPIFFQASLLIRSFVQNAGQFF